MNPWQKARNRSGWAHDGLVEWTTDLTAYLSVVYTWRLVDAYSRAAWFRSLGYYVRAGGPATRLMPHYLQEVADLSGEVEALSHHHPNATRTSRGCPHGCPFCAVPRIEDDLVELPNWPLRPIIIDDNFMATSSNHFNRAIDRLKPLQGIDFNQGLDVTFLTKARASRIAELDIPRVRIAWDHIGEESQFRRGFDLLTQAGIPASRIYVYVLIGWKDTPDNALYRLKTVWHELGAWPNPMRYQPLDAVQKNNYVARSTGWTDRELKRYMTYWANLRHLSGVPFEEYKLWQDPRRHDDPRQGDFLETQPE